MNALMATQGSNYEGQETTWYLDRGATNHCTPDASNLQNKADYYGQEQVFMGNGQCVNISSMGSNSFFF